MKTTFQQMRAKKNLTKNETLAMEMINLSFSDTIGATSEEEFDCDVLITEERVQIGYNVDDAIVVRTEYCDCVDMLVVPYMRYKNRLATDRILHMISDRHSLENNIYVSDVIVREHENSFEVRYYDRLYPYTVFDTYFDAKASE